MKKSILITLIAIIFMHCFAGCGSKGTTIDVKPFATVEVTGINGRGRAHVEVDLNSTSLLVRSFKGESKKSQDGANFEKTIKSMRFEIVSDKTEKLYNGDELKIKAFYNDEYIEELNVKMTNTEFTYVVSGLEEGTPIDLFAEVEIVYSGVSPEARVEVFNRSEKQYIRDIHYNVEPNNNLRTGDKIMVTAAIDTFDAESKGFLVPDILSKEYTVENIDEYAKDFNDLDQASRSSMENEALDRIGSACVNGYGSITRTLNLGFISSSKIKFGEPELVGIYFNVLKSGSNNNTYTNIFYVYKVSATVQDSAELHEGYVATRFSNAIKKADGTTIIDLSQDRSFPIFSADKEFDIVYSEVSTAQKKDYEVQEITP